MRSATVLAALIAAAVALPAVKRQDDMDSILAALEANNPEDAQAARTGMEPDKRQDDINAILAELDKNDPEEAAAVRAGLAGQEPADKAKRAEEEDPCDTGAASCDDYDKRAEDEAYDEEEDSCDTGAASCEDYDKRANEEDDEDPCDTGAASCNDYDKRQDDVDSILAELEKSDPEEAAAAKAALAGHPEADNDKRASEDPCDVGDEACDDYD